MALSLTPLETRSTLSLAGIFALRLLGVFMILPVFSLYAEKLNGATPTLIGISLGIYGLTQACLQIPFGFYSDRVGRRPIILGGLILFVIGSVISALTTSIEGMLIGRALQGSAAIGSVILALLADLIAPSKRSQAMAIVGIFIALTFALSLVVGPILAAIWGEQGIFWLSAVLGLIGMGVLYRLPVVASVAIQATPVMPAQAGIQELPVVARELATEAIQLPTQSQPPRHASRATPPLEGNSFAVFKNLLSDPQLLRLDASIFILHAILTALFVALPLLLSNTLHLQANHQWRFYLEVILCAFCVALPLLRFCETRGKAKQLNSLSIMFLGLSLVGFLVLPLTLVTTGFLLWIFFSAFTILEASLPSMVSKIAPPASKGTALGIYSTLQFAGIFCGGALGGSLLHFGANAVFLFCVGLIVIWLLIAARR